MFVCREGTQMLWVHMCKDIGLVPCRCIRRTYELVLDIMTSNDMFVVNTYFRPKKRNQYIHDAGIETVRVDNLSMSWS